MMYRATTSLPLFMLACACSIHHLPQAGIASLLGTRGVRSSVFAPVAGRRLAIRPQLARLRGGGGEANLAQLGEIVVPMHAKGGCATVRAAMEKAQEDKVQQGGIALVLVRSGGPEEAYKWEGALSVSFPVSIRGTEATTLRGVMLLEGTGGALTRLQWALEMDSGREGGLIGAINVVDGSWNITNCQLRGSEITVVAVEGEASVSIEDSYVGGFGTGPSCPYSQPLARDGIFAGGNCTLDLADSTFQNCGAFGGAALRATGASVCRAELCLFYQNDFVGLSIHQSTTVALSQCTFYAHGEAAFCATMAPRARLSVADLALEGAEWSDAGRPGVLREAEGGTRVITSVTGKEAKGAKRRLGEERRGENLRRLFSEVDSMTQDIIDDWAGQSQQLMNADEALEGVSQVHIMCQGRVHGVPGCV